jgi:hypothetical protein
MYVVADVAGGRKMRNTCNTTAQPLQHRNTPALRGVAGAQHMQHTAPRATHRRKVRNAAQHQQPGATGATPWYSMRGLPLQTRMCDMHPCATS